MMPIIFDKERAEVLLDCLCNGLPIPPATESCWSQADMLALAGACFFGAMSHGPPTLPGKKYSKLPIERREAVGVTFRADLQAAIELHRQLVALVRDGEFDEQYEPHIEAGVAQGDGELIVQPLKGFVDKTN